MDDWSPWAKKDPNMDKKFTGTNGEVGSQSYWNGNKEVGEGEQEIKNIIDGERIESELRFFKPFKSTSNCYTNVEDAGNGNTRVTWGFSGKNKFPMTIFSLFKSMDSMVGKDFEEGMDSLKEVLEK
jgi:flavodoxin